MITVLGPVGLDEACLCRKLGSAKIFSIDVMQERMQLARKLGHCEETIKAGPDNVSEVSKLTRAMTSSARSIAQPNLRLAPPANGAPCPHH
jgi:threonine dehydrogenase-like Zn-dependent dehydrogenase